MGDAKYLHSLQDMAGKMENGWREKRHPFSPLSTRHVLTVVAVVLFIFSFANSFPFVGFDLLSNVLRPFWLLEWEWKVLDIRLVLNECLIKLISQMHT